METALQDFLNYMTNIKKSSSNTIMSYHNDLSKLLRYLEKQNIVDVEKINETSLNSYILNMEKEGMSPATVSRSIASTKSFIFYLIKKGIIFQDPTERMRAPKVEKKPPHTLTLEQINSLLEQPDSQSVKGIRDKAMLELLYATGIRVSELITLRLEDVNLKSKYIRCCNKDKERVIPFGNMARQALDTYFQKVRTIILGNLKSDICFTNLSGEPMSRQGFWKIIKGYGNIAGIQDVITPQILRQSFAVHMMENGADIKSIQELLGHMDVSSTQVYLQGKRGRIREVYEESHPRA